jgi:hypothetical protein
MPLAAAAHSMPTLLDTSSRPAHHRAMRTSFLRRHTALRRHRLAVVLVAAGMLLVAPAVRGEAVGPAAVASLVGTVSLPGRSPATGAQILVTALRRVESTVPVPDVLLGRGLSGPDGSFALALTPGRAGAALASENGGHLNALVTALAPDGAAHSWLAVRAVPLRLVTGTAIPAAAGPLHLSMEQVTSTPGAAGALPENQCGTVTYRRGAFQYGYTTVAELHSWDDMAAKFRYVYHAASSIDVGTSQDGQSWKVSGTATIANDKGGTNGQDAAGRYGFQQRPQFEYEELVTQAAPCGGNRVLYHTATATRALAGILPGADVSGHDGFSQFTTNNRAGHMSDFAPGSFFAKTTGSTQRYEIAASFFGFNFGTTSQYSAELDCEWRMGHVYAPGQYHLWGDGPTVDDSHNVYAFSGPVPVGAALPLDGHQGR